MLVLLATRALAGCDPAGIDAVVDAVAQVRPEHHAMMAATGFADACSTPSGVVEAARTLPAMPPDMRQMIDMKAAAESPVAWMTVCTGSTQGLRILAKMAELPRDRQRDHLWTGCDLGSLGWFTQDEWRAADGSIVVALAGAHHAGQAGIPAPKVRILARALAGIGAEGGPSQDPVDDRFLEMPDLPELAPYPGGGGAFGDLVGPAHEQRIQDGASFRKRVEPTWSKKAVKQGGSCAVKVFVNKQGELRELAFIDCDKALQKDVQEAVEASKLKPRDKDGTKAAGRFTTTYTVD